MNGKEVVKNYLEETCKTDEAKFQEQQQKQEELRKQRIAERVAERKEAKRQESGQISLFDLGA